MPTPPPAPLTKDDLAATIAACVTAFQARADVVTRWRTPLVGVAAASDPLFARLPEVVRPTHHLPREVLPGARSVVAFFLPLDPRVPASNRRGRVTSEGWARAYVEGNALAVAISARTEALLAGRGHQVCTTPVTHNFDKVDLRSDWSHRHVAFIAGLGTFGLNHMLITAAGSCGRLGSFVTTAALEPDPRPTRELCRYKQDGSCVVCVERCVGEALTLDGYDPRRCYQMCLENEARYRHLGKSDVCGKCLAKLPCSHRAPPLRQGPPRQDDA